MGLEKVSRQLAALGHVRRLEIFEFVLLSEGGLRVMDIRERFKMAPATLAFHLGELHKAGILRSRKRGRNVYYSVDLSAVKVLLGFMGGYIDTGRIIPPPSKGA